MKAPSRFLLALLAAVTLLPAGCSRAGLFICGGQGDLPCPDGYSCVDNRCQPGVVGCAPGETTCSGRCSDPQTDEGNCGACGRACAPGAICQQGACSQGCPSGQAFCDGRCLDISSDSLHCGACNQRARPSSNASWAAAGASPRPSVLAAARTWGPTQKLRSCGLTPGALCQDGSCVTSCGPGLSVCGSGCVDLQSDAFHCGACNTTCRNNAICSAAHCVSTCPEGQLWCGGACVDPRTEPNNCGGCGIACLAGQACSNGQCVQGCAPDQMLCNGACVDLSVDLRNCGGCGLVCGPQESCDGGTCTLSCGRPLTLCDGQCVDTRATRHCGTCATVCARETRRQRACVTAPAPRRG